MLKFTQRVGSAVYFFLQFYKNNNYEKALYVKLNTRIYHNHT